MTVDQRAALLHQLNAKLHEASQAIAGATVYASQLAETADDWQTQQELIQIEQAIERLKPRVKQQELREGMK